MAEKTLEVAPDVTLSDGKAITFDKKKISRKDWASLFDPNQTPEEANEIIGRFTSTSAKYIADLSLHDWQLLQRVMFSVVQRGVDPNSPSGSISPS